MRILRLTLLMVCLLIADWSVLDRLALSGDNVLVEITAVDPAGKAALGIEEKLFVKVNYESDIPLRFQALAMWNGSALEFGAIKNAGLLHPSGKGEALAWVMYLNTTHVNGIKVTVLDEQWQQLYQLTERVDVTWQEGANKPSRAQAEWVKPLIRAEKRLTDFFYDPEPHRFEAFYEIFFYVNLAAIPVYILLQLHMLYRYRYRWRELSMIPLFPYLIVGFYVLFGLHIDRSLLITFLFRYTFCALLWLAAVWLAKRFWQDKLPPPKLYKPPKA